MTTEYDHMPTYCGKCGEKLTVTTDPAYRYDNDTGKPLAMEYATCPRFATEFPIQPLSPTKLTHGPHHDHWIHRYSTNYWTRRDP